MYERFTDRARKVMQLANQEAQRFNHEYIGTEHILLGLVKELRIKPIHLWLALLREPQSAAMRIIESLGLHPEQLRAELLRHLDSDAQDA